LRTSNTRRVQGATLRTRLWVGWVAGIGLYGPGLYWATTFNVAGGIVLIVVESLALSLACGACGRGRGRIVALPGAMVLAEWVRDIWPFGGLPLGGVALGQATGPLVFAARIGGPLLLTGLVWLGGAAIGSLVTSIYRTIAIPVWTRRIPAGWRGLAEHHGVEAAPADFAHLDRRRRTRLLRQPKLGPLVAGAVGIAAVIAFSVVGAVSPDGGAPLKIIRVATVQGGGARGFRKSQVNPETVYDAQLEANAEIPPGSKPALVVWPEDVVSLAGPIAGTSTEQTLGGLARRLHTTLLVGVTETASAQSFRNEVVAFGPSGSIVGTYEKVHRVPFGEYVPFRGFFSHLANLSAVPQDAIPGRGTGYMSTPGARVGLMVSYEVFFAVAGRSATRAGAQLLVVPTNTSSYSTSQVPTQELAAAQLQAIEEGRDLVQVAPTGFSAIIDNSGRVLQRSVLGARQVLVANVALRDGSTIYERYGDTPILLLAALALLLGWLLDITEPSRADRSPGAAAARANWRRLRDAGSSRAAGEASRSDLATSLVSRGEGAPAREPRPPQPR
jgi:apolipoprotein N-acyltransferase